MKTDNFRKSPTRAEVIDRLSRGAIALPPLAVRLLRRMPIDGGAWRFDALVEARWSGLKARFAAKIALTSTPKTLNEAVESLKSSKLRKDWLPMVVVPFLDQHKLEELERRGVSGIDMCGNGVVVAPGKLVVLRTGQENRFSTWAPIKNVYRKKSSLVGRAFLACPKYQSVNDVLEQVRRCDYWAAMAGQSSPAISTVSKVLTAMEQDLLVARARGGVRLIQAGFLVDKLAGGYVGPEVRASVLVKSGLERAALVEVLAREAEAIKCPLVASGLSSVSRYATMQRGAVLAVYTTDGGALLKRLPAAKPDRFPDLQIVETVDPTVYFDSRKDGLFRWASPIQVFLELTKGDKRDIETAAQVKEYIVRELAQVMQ
jgi:hypothetical protein